MSSIPINARPAAAPMTSNERTVIFASSLGTVFEWYDFYLFGVMAPIIAANFFTALDPATRDIFTLLAFAAGFAVRPFGAIVFGTTDRLDELTGPTALAMPLEPPDTTCTEREACRPSAVALTVYVPAVTGAAPRVALALPRASVCTVPVSPRLPENCTCVLATPVPLESVTFTSTRTVAPGEGVAGTGVTEICPPTTAMTGMWPPGLPTVPARSRQAGESSRSRSA